VRLVTRSDFDGLVCAVLLKQVEQIDSIQFVHPKDLQDGTFLVTEDDILTNVPYVPGCGLWFDHHASEIDRVVGKFEFKGSCHLAPSAARVVYDYYGGGITFGRIDTMMAEVDKADSAQFSKEEILNPKGWPLLSFIMDARTGLGRFKDYRISNYQLMYELIDACTYMRIEQILRLPDVQERVERYFQQNELYQKMVTDHSTLHGGVIVTDLRSVDPIYSGNRFLIYALFPEAHTSIWIVDGLQKKNCVFACGHSIINRKAPSKIGAIMRRFGGGGHDAAGTCQVPHDIAEETLRVLIAGMNHPVDEYAKAA